MKQLALFIACLCTSTFAWGGSHSSIGAGSISVYGNKEEYLTISAMLGAAPMYQLGSLLEAAGIQQNEKF